MTPVTRQVPLDRQHRQHSRGSHDNRRDDYDICHEHLEGRHERHEDRSVRYDVSLDRYDVRPDRFNPRHNRQDNPCDPHDYRFDIRRDYLVNCYYDDYRRERGLLFSSSSTRSDRDPDRDNS